MKFQYLDDKKLLAAGVATREAQSKPPFEAKFSAKPTASIYGKGYFKATDVGVNGSMWYSDGSSWSHEGWIDVIQDGAGYLVPSLAAANAATYSQTLFVITVTSTAHGIPATTSNGSSVYLAMGSAATGDAVPAGWFTNFTYVDANTFTCVSTVSQTGTGSVNTNLAAINVPALTTTLPGGVLGLNGVIRMSLEGLCFSSANNKVIRGYYGAAGNWLTLTPTTAVSYWMPVRTLSNRNNTASQRTQVASALVGYVSASAPVSLAINSALDQDIFLSLQCVAASEFVSVSNFLVEVLPS